MKFERGKYGLKQNPVGAQVKMSWQGRTLLGDVKECYMDAFEGVTLLRVNHFNGEPWPLDPHVFSVTVLEGRNEGDGE
jgi:hypothetical protein